MCRGRSNPKRFKSQFKDKLINLTGRNISDDIVPHLRNVDKGAFVLVFRWGVTT